jgi:hypothetical protein
MATALARTLPGWITYCYQENLSGRRPRWLRSAELEPNTLNHVEVFCKNNHRSISAAGTVEEAILRGVDQYGRLDRSQRRSLFGAGASAGGACSLRGAG